MQAALKQDKQRPDILRNLGLTYAKQGQIQPAIQHFEAYLKQEPQAEDAAKIRKVIQDLKELQKNRSR